MNREAGRTVLDVVGLGGSFVPADSEDGDGGENDNGKDGVSPISIDAGGAGAPKNESKVIRLV